DYLASELLDCLQVDHLDQERCWPERGPVFTRHPAGPCSAQQVMWDAGCKLPRRLRTVGHDAFARQISILLASFSTSTARTGQPVLTWLLVSRPETRAVWVLCWHQPPKRACRNMSEPSFAGVNSLPSRNFYFFSHAIRNLTSHPR